MPSDWLTLFRALLCLSTIVGVCLSSSVPWGTSPGVSTLISVLGHPKSCAIEQDHLSKYLVKEFVIKTLGHVKYLLSIEVVHSSKGIFISQQKYVVDLLKNIEKSTHKQTSTPLDPTHKLCFGGNFVTWCSKKQSVVAHSSAEVEFRALVPRICALL
ncbi:unnamed protein product [Spirodela intermedia]|uniref:Uncharacterized protein n=1 Tax=Spirodela intermedia TaxID=51605 RepID=A0A7I8L282_SPIIN|nr:unnamed protein product [Spirodela intermedia]